MNDREESVILVDEADRQVGIAGKIDAHERGLLHRAFSVLVHDEHGRWLMQHRAMVKYHSGGLWTNAACGHPRPGEPVANAASRRLEEEMGFSCPLNFVGTARYRSALDHGMIENELVSVYCGVHSGAVRPDPAEADGFDWVSEAELKQDVADRPERYTVWFKKYVDELWDRLAAA